MGHTYSSNSPQRDLIPYLYTGKYLTSLIDMDARWYNPQVGRFIQPDYYNLAELALPNGARNKLLATTSLNTQMLLNDPSQQMRYGYVSGNPMRWVDPMGLEKIFGTLGAVAEESALYWANKQLETGNPLYAVPGLAASLLSFEDDYFDETDVKDALLGGAQITGGAAQSSAGAGLFIVPGTKIMSATLIAHGTGNIAGGVGNLANSIDGGDRDYNFTQNIYQTGAAALSLPQELGTVIHAGVDLYTGVSLAMASSKVRVVSNVGNLNIPLVLYGEKVVPHIQTLSGIAAFHELVQIGASSSSSSSSSAMYNAFTVRCSE